MTDSQIIALFWERNEDAIQETDAVYGRKLYAISDKILHSLQDAEESVSDTYMKAWETIPPQKPNYFFAYLAKICRNFSLRRIEWNTASKRNAEVVALTKEMEVCIPDRSYERKLEGEELGKVLNRFLDSISLESRLIFMRRYWYTDSIQEIADRYRMSQSKVKTQLHRTRNKLQLFFGKRGDLCMSGKELFEGMSYVDERYVDEADCVILDLSSKTTKPFHWNAYRIHGRFLFRNKRRVAIILLAAALMLALVSCGVAAVINVDSIQTWFSHYWKQITEHEMDTAQIAVIHELSQKIGQSVTDGALTITVDSATGSEDIFYILVRVEGHPFTHKHRYSFVSKRLTVEEEALPDNLSVSSFGIHYLGVAEDGAGLFLIDYDYATSDGDLGDIEALPMTLYLKNMTRRNPNRDLNTAQIVEEGTWSISFTLDRSQISEKVQIPDAEVGGMNCETYERVPIILTDIILSNTGIRFTYDSQHGSVEPYSGIFVLLKNGARIEGGQGTGTVEEDLTTLNYDWHWSIPLNLDDIASISIGGTEIPINLESN